MIYIIFFFRFICNSLLILTKTFNIIYVANCIFNYLGGIISMKFFSKLCSLAIAGSMMLGMSSTVFAADSTATVTPQVNTPSNPVIANVDLNSLDLNQPFSEKTSFTDQNGKPAVLTLSYTPATKSSKNLLSSNQASAGTWTSTVNMAVITMSYTFDVSKSGSEWKISSPRALSYSGLFCTFSNSKLSVSHAISSSSIPAEIDASVDAEVFNNAWVHLYSATWTMNTTITHSGTMTVNHN